MAGASEAKGARPEPSKNRLKALIYLGAAIVAALATAVLLTRYMDTRIAAVRVPTVKVVVARSDLSIATTLRADVLEVVDWPAVSQPDGIASDPAQLEGKVVNVSIGKGEPILQSKLARAKAGARSPPCSRTGCARSPCAWTTWWAWPASSTPAIAWT